MNVAMASSRVTNLAQSETKSSVASSATDRRRTLSPPTSSRSSAASLTRARTPPCTRSTTPPRVTDPESFERSTLERLRASPGANLLAGGVGGLASLVVGHPFDTVKVRLQTMRGAGPPQYSNARDCLLKIMRNEGPGTLFRGMSAL